MSLQKTMPISAVTVDLIASVPISLSGSQSIVDGIAVTNNMYIYPAANTSASDRGIFFTGSDHTQPWVLSSHLINGYTNSYIQVNATQGNTYGGRSIYINNTSTGHLSNLSHTIPIDAASDVTVTPNGVQTLNEFTTGNNDLVLLMVDPNAGYYKTSSSGVWELLCLFANIPDGTVFRGNNPSSLWFPQLLTVDTVNGVKCVLQSPPSTKENVVVMGTNGSDLLPRTSWVEPFQSISTAQTYAVGDTNFKNITVWEAPTSGLFDETIGSIVPLALVDYATITAMGYSPIKELLLDADVGVGGNLTFTNLNLGTRGAATYAIQCQGSTGFGALNTTFFGTGISSTLGRVGGSPVYALNISDTSAAYWGMNFINYYIDGNMHLGGNYQIDIYNQLQYNNATTDFMVGSDVNAHNIGQSYKTYHSTDFEYYGHTETVSAGALSFKGCTATQTVAISIDQPAIATDNDLVQLYFENCNGDFQVAQTRVTGLAFVVYANSSFTNQDLTLLPNFQQGTSPRADGVKRVVPTNGGSYNNLNAFNNAVNFAPTSNISTYTVAMPITTSAGLVSGYTIKFKNVTAFTIANLTFAPASGQTIVNTQVSMLPYMEMLATWEGATHTWTFTSIVDSASVSRFGITSLGADHTLSTSDSQIIQFNATATLTLPAISGFEVGKIYTVFNNTNFSTVTINPTTGWTDGNTTPFTVPNLTGVSFYTDGIDVNWLGIPTVSAGNGLTLTRSSLSINTAITADLSTPQTLSNKTFVAPILGSAIGTSLTVSGGNLSVGSAGNGLSVKEGSNAKQGIAILVGGTAVVSNTSVTANSRIILTGQNLGTITVPVGYAVSARTPGTSFTILSANVLDTSTVAYQIFEPA